VISVVAWPSGQTMGGSPAVGQQPPAAGTGFIAGQVVDAATGRPVAEVSVNAAGRGAPGGGRGAVTPAVIADAQGRFFFRNLAQGNYTLTANKPGYTMMRPSIVELADAERTLDVRIRVSRLGAISGALRDSAGDPVVGTSVVAFLRSFSTGRLQ